MVLFVVIISLTGCIDNSSNIVSKNDDEIKKDLSEENKFIGRWESDDGVIFIFNYNHECSMEGFFYGTGDWELENDTIYITLEYKDGQNFMAFNYEFSEENTVLKLVDPGGRGRVYYKQ